MGSEVGEIRRRILQLGRLTKAEEQEMHLLVEQLVDRGMEAPKPRKFGNPAVVGLAGFGITTLMLQLHNLGCMKAGPVLWLGLIYGGLAQFIAGLLEFGTGNNFGFSAFTTYGAFWISLVATLLAGDYSKYEARDPELAIFLAAFALYTFIMFVASTRHNLALAVVFLTLVVGLLLLSFYHFFPRNAWLLTTGACVLMVCALSALYVMAHLIFLESFQFDLLPVGPPIHKWFSKGNRPVTLHGVPKELTHAPGTKVIGDKGENHGGIATIQFNGT